MTAPELLPCPVCSIEGRTVCPVCDRVKAPRESYGVKMLPAEFVVNFALLIERINSIYAHIDLEALNAIMHEHLGVVLDVDKWHAELTRGARPSLLVEDVTYDPERA